MARDGLAAGDRVAFVCPNSAGLVSALLGCLRAGVVPVPVDPGLHEAEQRVVLDDARPARVVRPADLPALLEGPPGELAHVPRTRPMHYTSGTTGRPKGVWGGVLDDAAARAIHDDEATLWGFDAGDRLLVVSPLHHSAPLRFAAGTLLAGGELFVLERFDAGAVAAAIDAVRPTIAFMVPAHLQRLFAAGVPDLSSFRLLAHAGAPCPPEVKRAAIDAFPAGSVWEFYGATEGQFTACPSGEWLEHPGTVGRARPGRRLEIDGDGRVWCHAPAFARFEYWNDPDATAAAWRGDAFTVGDLGRLDDGYLFLHGRRDDLIISGGENVYPVEVEGVLRRLPGVDDVVVFGVPDRRWGERVCAAVVGDADPGAVVRAARDRLAGYKCPKDVYVVDELPRTSTGKVRRSAMADVLGLR